VYHFLNGIWHFNNVVISNPQYLLQEANLMENIMERDMEHDMKLYAVEQRLCDIADSFLQILDGKRFTTHDSLRIIEKMKKTLETAIESAHGDKPLI
jgi:uncharacterized phage-like protein YoqJ